MNVGIPDIEQRQRALTPDESFIVQAPAGSGKTELLIQRYLRLLAIVELPEEIIAITFTKKAAAEMRGRIIQALQQVTQEASSEDLATQQTYELAREALARDKLFDWQLQENPTRLCIQTIDALCAGLTRQMPVLANLGAQPETIEDPSELYKEAASLTLELLESGLAWSDSIAVLLVHLDNNLPRARDMLASMLARRDQWLRHVAGKQVNRAELEQALKHVVESTLSKIRECFPDELEQDFLCCLQFAANNLEWQQSEFVGLPATSAEELAIWQGIAELCLTQKDEWRKQVNKNQGFPAGANNKETKELMQTMLGQLGEYDNLLKLLAEVRRLPPVSYTDTEWQVVSALCELLVLADAQLRLLFAERNQIDFVGIVQAAIYALGDEQSPTDLALQLDYRIKHILVDEFQDISINQYVLLQQLTRGWSSEETNTLFLVGDPMQSIYRFREAEVGLFLNTWKQQHLGQIAITPLNISMNFRSTEGIVDWVNSTFSQILPDSADVARGAVNYMSAIAYHEQTLPQAVNIHAIIESDSEQEAKFIVQEIKQTRLDDPEGRIAILVRSRTHLQAIVPALQNAGIGFRAVEIEELGQQAEIQDLIALTRAMHHFADRVAWLAILRAPWCGLSLADLLILAGKEKQKTLWFCMRQGEGDGGELIFAEQAMEQISTEGKARLIRIRSILQSGFTRQNRLPLSRWIQSIWIQIGGPATLENETDLENAHTFFQLLDQFDEGGDLKDRDEFIARVEKLYAAADINADDSLQIMTIHKSKGLEFDTVMLPGLERKARGDESHLLMWAESPYEDRQDLLLALVKESIGEDPPIYNFLKGLEKEKQNYEDGRLLYVAATRAIKRLHLFGTVSINDRKTELEISKPVASSLLGQLWHVVKAEYQNSLETYQHDSYQQHGSARVVNNSLRRLKKDWQLPEPPSAVRWNSEPPAVLEDDITEIEFEWAGETIKHVGTVVHRCIQWIAEEGVQAWGEERINSKQSYFEQALKRLRVPKEELVDAVNRVEQALFSMLKDERGRWLLSKEYEDERNEYAISGLYRDKIVNVVIDRTFVDEQGIRWIVEYKTSRHEEEDVEDFLDLQVERYRRQLNKYAKLMSHQDDKVIMLGLYFPLLKGWRQWEYK